MSRMDKRRIAQSELISASLVNVIFLQSYHIDTASTKVYNQINDTASTHFLSEGSVMIKGTPELIAGRREEIINACEKLYKTMSFKEITLKEIGSEVPFSRPTIYNYFRTKEEIFLALFQREYENWNTDLSAILNGHDTLNRQSLAAGIAETLANRIQLLKLLSMNNYDMEANSRPELLTDFKKAYGNSLLLVRALLEKFCPEMSDIEIRTFIYIFFPFMFGIYPYAEVTDKQKEAMRDAGVDYTYQTVYEIIYNCLNRLLDDDRETT